MEKFEYNSSKNDNDITPQRKYKYPMLGFLTLYVLLLFMFLFFIDIDIDKSE